MIIKVDSAKVKALADAARITELKALLADSDYKVLPDYDKTDDALIAQRQAWREEIRALTAATV
jgi:hypothetical protein